MMKQLLLIAIALSSLCCGPDTDHSQTKVGQITLSEPTITTLAAPDSLIGYLEHPAVTNDNYILFKDRELNKIHVFDKTFNHVSSFGRQGAGPLEFRHVTSAAISDENVVFVFDAILQKIKLFDVHGELLETLEGPLGDSVWGKSDRLYIRNNKMYFAAQEPEKVFSGRYFESIIAAEMNMDGSVSQLFGHYDDIISQSSSTIYKYPNIVIGPDSLMFVTHRSYHGVNVFDIHSKQHLHRFEVTVPQFKSEKEAEVVYVSDPRSVRNKKNLTRSFVGDSFVDGQYFYFYFFNFTDEFWKTKDPNVKDHYVAVYDIANNYRHIGTIELDKEPFLIENNQLYLKENDDPDNYTISISTINL